MTTITRHESSAIYSKVVEANGFVFTAGIVATRLDADVKGQTEEILAEIDRLLALCGTDRSRIVSANLYLADMRTRDAANAAWTPWTGGRDLPARTAIEAKLADPRMLVEIGVVAAK
jgi:enamine deaminase RidA (YjgF/YER057c/UK114 family)